MAMYKLFIAVSFITFCAVENIKVNINSVGKVRGATQLIEGRLLDSFWAIPFALPPVGDLRFAPPKPAKPWTGTRNATVTRILCHQSVYLSNAIVGQEDCLYLNIFRPRAAVNKTMPVLFWVHGGSFVRGSAFNFNGDILAANHDVIVVTVNYRLGILGFFNVPGSKESGNYGLLDQIEALKWVNQHIADFGGDPNNVTISGLSAGAVSVTLLMISPLAKGLFTRVIAQSGCPTASWAIRENINETFSMNFASKLGCNELATVKSCLRGVSSQSVVKAQSELPDSEMNVLPFVDNHVIKEYPYKQYKEGRFPVTDAELLIGFTKDEGTMFLPNIRWFNKAILEAAIKRDIHFHYGSNATLVTQMALFHYQQFKRPNDVDYRNAIKEFIDDFFFKMVAMNYGALWARGKNSTFVYEFTYYPDHAIYPHWGVAHAIEKAFVFGTPLRRMDDPWRTNELVGNFTDDDKIVSKNVMKMWTDFVKTGIPHVGWPRFDGQNRRYIDIGLNITFKENFNPRMMSFWNEYIPTVLKLKASKEDCSKTSSSSSSSFISGNGRRVFLAAIFCLFLGIFH